MGSNNVTKAEILDKLFHNTDLNKNQCKVAFESIVDLLIDYVSEGNRIELRGFGVFNSKARQPRMARNPRTGEEVKLGVRYVPVFKPSPDFIKKVDDKLGKSKKKAVNV
ncbi:MAG: HU family DNA-binding protein [Candidatus Kapaibacteriales bacterium]